MKKRNVAIILGSVGAIILLGVGVVAAISITNGNHNWNLGLAPQKNTADIATVQQAVESVQNEAILDAYVYNANTSGTPFGHSTRIDVLVDEDLISAGDDAAIQALAEEITQAVQKTGVKDTYDLMIGLDVNTRITSGGEPATSAKDMFMADIVYDESFEVK